MNFREECRGMVWLLWVAGIGSLICMLWDYCTNPEPYAAILLIASVLVLIFACWISFPPDKSSKK